MMSVKEVAAMVKLFEDCSDYHLRREILRLVPDLAELTKGGYAITASGKTIKCLRCGMLSSNVKDVENRYCGFCHRFHDEDDGA